MVTSLSYSVTQSERAIIERREKIWKIRKIALQVRARSASVSKNFRVAPQLSQVLL